MGRKFFIGGNWKNGTIDNIKKNVETLNIAQIPSLDAVEVVVTPPFAFLSTVKEIIRHDFQVAAQDITSEMSAEMLANLNIPWVILENSEGGHLLGDANFIADKVESAMAQGVNVIPCVGETLKQRELEQTVDVVIEQTKAIADKVKDWTKVVIAYEPAWANGTGKVATPAQAQEVHHALRNWLKENVSVEVSESTRIVYGGSVNAANSKEMAAQPDVDGFLVGGASLKPEFVAIINYAKVKLGSP